MRCLTTLVPSTPIGGQSTPSNLKRKMLLFKAMTTMSNDDVEEDEAFDGHSFLDNPSVDIIGVICLCICGREFVACSGCLLNGDVHVCPDCQDKLQSAHLN